MTMRVLALAVAFVYAGVLAISADTPDVQPLRWEDLPAPIERRLVAAGLDARGFPAFRDEQARVTRARVRESDLDALIYYALQSTAFTKAPPIEPAISAKAFVEGADLVPADVRRRIAQLIPALRRPSANSRLSYFREAIPREKPAAEIETFLLQQYVRAARFLYEKEFLAPRQPESVDAIASLYRQRALSTDTSVEAGYLVHLGLATMRALDDGRRVRRVLIVGPGLELAPRTGLLELGPPQSYQPYAVLDALVGLGLARLGEVVLLCADVNPRVVDHLQAAKSGDVTLALVSGIGDSATTSLEDDYRRYFDELGRSIGHTTPLPALPDRYRGHLRKSWVVRGGAARVIEARRVDISHERLALESFDLIIATNVFLYMDDIPLTLALTSLASTLAPGGVLIHNETRALVADVTAEQNLPVAHARTAQIASVRGAAAPLYDSVFVHVKGNPR